MRHIVPAILASILIASAAVPAQAQGFGIFFGDEPSDFFGGGIFDDDDDERSGYPYERMLCLTDRQERNAVADLGYSDIALNVRDERHVQVRATQGGYVYLLDFNVCSGYVEGRQRLRRAG